VAVTVVAIVIAVLLLHHAGSASSAKLGSSTSTTKPHKSTTTTLNVIGGGSVTTTTQAPVPPAQVRLQVLNGVGTGSYAGEFSTKLHANPGYNTQAPDNATATVGSSAIYIVTAGYLPEAKALATTLGVSPSIIVQTTPPPSTAPIPALDLTKADLVLVVGPDLVSKA
jgi:hypothetical protein